MAENGTSRTLDRTIITHQVVAAGLRRILHSEAHYLVCIRPLLAFLHVLFPLIVTSQANLKLYCHYKKRLL